MKTIILIGLLAVSTTMFSQRVAVTAKTALLEAAVNKPSLTHDVYDSWETLTERVISNNGNIIVYTVNPQEGDGTLYIKNADKKLLLKINRGYNATITNDNLFVICKIRPLFKETREAKIKKKKADDMPKDSLAIYNITTDSLTKIAKVKSYKTAEKGSGYIAYLLEKIEVPKKTIVLPDSVTQINTLLKMADSLRKVADSLIAKTQEAKAKGLLVLQPAKKESKPTPKLEDLIEEGTDLVIKNLNQNNELTYKMVTEYYFDKVGKKLLIESTKKNTDTLSKAKIVWLNLANNIVDTIYTGFNDAKNYAIDDSATQLAFVMEKDSVAKALQKFYKLVYYNTTQKNATVIATRNTGIVKNNFTVSADYNNIFSKDGTKLYYGIAPVRKPKDTTLVDFETAKLDVWNYNDDYLQPQQLLQAANELKRSNLCVFHTNTDKHVQLGNDTLEAVLLLTDGNSNQLLAISDYGKRAAGQWQGYTNNNAYLINAVTGNITSILQNERVSISASPNANYVIWYNWDTRKWITYNTKNAVKTELNKNIKVPLYDEDDDHPDAPPPHGLVRWAANDKYVYLYDKYDIWQCDPSAATKPTLITNGRATKTITRWVNTDADDKYLVNDKAYLFTTFNEITKKMGIALQPINNIMQLEEPFATSFFKGFVRAKDNLNCLLYTSENSQNSPYLVHYTNTNTSSNNSVIHRPNEQQNNYNWYTTELINWKMYDGKMSEGLLYKPENFDATKKYPIIFYFYERDADNLYNYRGPAPSASTINIPYFVSNGYIVFDPNIYYKNGEPGQSAFNSVVSAAKYLTKTYNWIDSTKMAIQGQSWGGYQVAYLVTRTNIFAAASAGAPVSNMTSAYGGIRWGSGISRQFQYEKSQTRIGGTLWNKRDLYIKNSPLFFADKVTTPLLLMHNDKDGAVPWYQSIEYFTALKRLGKKVWLLQYNDEDHNLVERRNRKDLSKRLAQFFDYYLKNKPQPTWMQKGVAAIDKGIEWGL